MLPLNNEELIIINTQHPVVHYPHFIAYGHLLTRTAKIPAQFWMNKIPFLVQFISLILGWGYRYHEELLLNQAESKVILG